MPLVSETKKALIVATTVALSLVTMPATASVQSSRASVSFHRPLPPAPTVGTSEGPVGIAVNSATRTAYVASVVGVDVVDISHCNGRISRGCTRSVTTLPIGTGNSDIAIDPDTATVYVVSTGDDTVRLFGERRCNARDTTGCTVDQRRVHVGPFPSYLAVDDRSRTVYVSNAGSGDFDGNTVSMIDATSCKAEVGTGCAESPPTVTVGTGPQGMAVDPRTGTLYVTNLLTDDVSVVDTSTCNARIQRGCADVAAAPVSTGPGVALVDQESQTLYVAGGAADELGALSMIDVRTCHAGRTVGCTKPAPTARIGSIPIAIAADPATRTLYVANEEDSAVSVIDETRCNANRTDGCRPVSNTMSGGFNSGGVAVDHRTHAVYLSSQDEDTLTVLDGTRCNGRVHVGCAVRAPATTVGIGAAASAVDESSGTLYVPNQGEGTVSVVDTSACNAFHLAGCGKDWPKIKVGNVPKAIVIDHATHTAYVSDYQGSTVAVIDTTRCSARHTSGCGDTPIQITMPGGAYTLALDPSTHTIYVALVDDGAIAVIDAATCNAEHHSGCQDPPRTVPVSDQPAGVIVDEQTSSVYVTGRSDGIVSLLDARTCNGAVASSCAVVATTPVGVSPRFMVVDPRTHTLYVANKDSDTLSMIDTATCSARTTTGCGDVAPTASVGHLPYGLELDMRTQHVYVGNVGDSTVGELQARRCNATTQGGCSTQRIVDTGGWPTSVAVDQSRGTVYISDNVDAQVSIARETGARRGR